MPFDSLPGEILFEISQCLPLFEGVQLELLSKGIHQALDKEGVWRVRCERDWATFWDVGARDLDAQRELLSSWREVYKIHALFGSLLLGKAQRVVLPDRPGGFWCQPRLPGAPSGAGSGSAPSPLQWELAFWDPKNNPPSQPACMALELLRSPLTPSGWELRGSAPGSPCVWSFQRLPGSGRRLYACCAPASAEDEVAPSAVWLPRVFALEPLPPLSLHAQRQQPSPPCCSQQLPALPTPAPPPPPHARLFQGLWRATYGGHGEEVLQLRVGLAPPDMVPPTLLHKGSEDAWPVSARQPKPYPRADGDPSAPHPAPEAAPPLGLDGSSQGGGAPAAPGACAAPPPLPPPTTPGGAFHAQRELLLSQPRHALGTALVPSREAVQLWSAADIPPPAAVMEEAHWGHHAPPPPGGASGGGGSCFGGGGVLRHLLVGAKVVGDPNVPSGCFSWVCDLSREVEVEVEGGEDSEEEGGEEGEEGGGTAAAAVWLHPAWVQVNQSHTNFAPRWVKGHVQLTALGGKAARVQLRALGNISFYPIL
jgi:hypothetical protein